MAFWWLQKYLLLKLGGIPVYRVNSKGLIYGAVEEFKKIDNYILVIAPEAVQSQYLSLEVVFTI